MDDRLPEELDTEVSGIEDLPAERQDRLRSLVDLQRRGMSNAMIAKLLRVGEATVYPSVISRTNLFCAVLNS